MIGDSTIQTDLIGGRVWLDLLEAAGKFVVSLDYTAESSTPLSVNGRCVLCWQDLDNAAATRLTKFQQHLEGTAAEAQQKAAQQLKSLADSLHDIPDSITDGDRAIVSSDEHLPQYIRQLMKALAARRDAILSIQQEGAKIGPLPEIDGTPLEMLRVKYRSTKKELQALPDSDTEAALRLKELEMRHLDLMTRRKLSESLEAAENFVKLTKEQQRLKDIYENINTHAASSKVTKLHRKHITSRFEASLENEYRSLHFRRQTPVLGQKTRKGRVEITPLVSAKLKHIQAARVFSEGERTVIALACFLAELQLGEDPSGLIFDDPVSSLDHSVREHVARRLVRASKERQVIVFTHDLAFLADLREQAKKIQTVDCQFRTLIATDDAVGFVEAEVPFGASNVNKRINLLKIILDAAGKASKNGDVDALRSKGRDFYERLRSTWERFIEERLFASVVRRLERNVMVGALPKVTYTQQLGETAHEGWRRCSTMIRAHDHASAAGGRRYSVGDMEEDLKVLIDAAGKR